MENGITDASNSPLFEIQEVPGKGKGLVARSNIAKGTRILYEQPLFTMVQFSPASLLENTIATQLRMLSRPQQRQFFSLHNNFPGRNPLTGIVRTNALPCGPDSLIGAIYATLCRANHSCLPNANPSWNDDFKAAALHAMRDIPAGEEITISYDEGGPSSARRALLRDNFGFDCTCEVCSLAPPELQVSDARRVQIEQLDDAIGDIARALRDPDACLADCRALLRLLEEEYSAIEGGVLLARLYHDAYELCITHGDEARASVFARRVYDCRAMLEGEDNPETWRMAHRAANPAELADIDALERWKTTMQMVPRDLAPEEFEKWLWRERTE